MDRRANSELVLKLGDNHDKDLTEVCHQWSWCRLERASLLCHMVCPKDNDKKARQSHKMA